MTLSFSAWRGLGLSRFQVPMRMQAGWLSARPEGNGFVCHKPGSPSAPAKSAA
jgi:hypothetical protein